MYQALYRKYRPSNFNEVAGQKLIVKTLINSILNNKLSHAYLFSGPRGTGKTSIAKILAKTINCKNLDGYIPCNNCNSCECANNKENIDIIEIDAASNNGVDEIRELKNSVNLVPNHSKYKVYIIDEVHMLTISAFNALLKTLEEPPSFVIFILATTEIHKVPETILSRCQKFDFKKISDLEIVERLKYICEKENIKVEEEALKLIARYSNGGMRDAVNLLDQINSYSDNSIGPDEVKDVCGDINNEQMQAIIKLILNNELKTLLEKIKIYDSQGKNLVLLFENLIEYLKNLLIYMNASDYFENSSEIIIYKELASLITEKKIYEDIQILLEYLKNMKYENNKLILAQLAFIKVISNHKTVVERKIIDNKEIIKAEKVQADTKTINKKQPNNNTDRINNINLKVLEELKKIRINNALSKFNKKDLMDFKEKIDSINELLMDPEYSYLVSLIMDGSLKIKGDKYLVFVYDNEQLALYFNSELISIEQMFKKNMKYAYKVIAIDSLEWDRYKKEFNENMKLGNNKFVYQEEDEELIKNYIVKKEDEIKKNDIDNLFSEIVKYE